MSIHYFVRKYDNLERKIYINANNLLQHKQSNFMLDDDSHIYSIKDVDIESGDFEVVIPMFILGFIGFLIHPFIMIIGIIIGFIMGYYLYIDNELKLKKVKEELEKLK